jgi:uncharacterized phage protein (TIGR01671 family)
MRQIKYRAWDTINHCMYYQVTAIYPWTEDNQRVTCRVNNGHADFILRECIVMQYTGIEDKNGKKIYNNDILEFTIWPDLDDGYSFDTRRITDQVVFRHGCFSLDERMDLLSSIQPTREPLVIGNIYENPELMEDK